jgi:hypothetical protein
MLYTIHVDIVDLFSRITVVGLSDDLDLVPGASSGMLTTP